MSAAPFGRGRRAARLLAHVIDAAVWAGARVPAPVAHAMATVGGTIEWALRPAKRHRLAVNLAHAVGQHPDSRAVRRLVRRELRNEARRSADLLWALGKPDDFLSTVELTGIEHAQAVAASGSGLILAGTHLGGWEVATAVPAAVLPVPTEVIVADDWLAWAIEHARVAVGLRVIYRPRAALSAVRALRHGHAVLALGDDGRQTDHRRRVKFLDAHARLPSGIAAMSRLGQAPVLTFHVLPLGRRRWQVTVDAPLDAPTKQDGDAGEHRLMQALADRWSDQIRAHPEHWAASYPIEWSAAPT